MQVHNPAVIIPAYNEEASVGVVVSKVREACSFPVIVIDDASSDNTRQEAVAAGAEVLSHSINLGAWGATQTGIRYALQRGHTIVVSIDADGQHDPDQIDCLTRPVLSDVAHVVIGACPQRGSRARRCAWFILRSVSGIELTDLTSGFRAYGREAMIELASWRATYLDFQDIGVLALLISEGLLVKDVSVNMHQRLNGRSRIFNTWMTVFFYMCRTILLGFTKRQVSAKKLSDRKSLFR